MNTASDLAPRTTATPIHGPGLPPAFLKPAPPRSPISPRPSRPTVLPALPAVPSRRAGDLAPHGTTIVAATFPGGVVVAGDRRATMGNMIAQRDIEKVFPADEFSIIGIAGAAGLAVEMVRLFQARAGALREDRGRAAVPGRQGQPAGHDDPAEPRSGHAGADRRAAVRRLGPGSRRGPDLLLRRHRRPVRGARRSSRSARGRCSPAAR